MKLSHSIWAASAETAARFDRIEGRFDRLEGFLTRLMDAVQELTHRVGNLVERIGLEAAILSTSSTILGAVLVLCLRGRLWRIATITAGGNTPSDRPRFHNHRPVCLTQSGAASSSLDFAGRLLGARGQ